MHRDDELKALSEHLLYEVEMLFKTADRLSAIAEGESVPWEVRMALIEAFAVRARAMIEFLWQDETRWKEDALAVDFFEPGAWAELRPEMESTLGDVTRRAGQEIAHLTYHRVRVVEDAKGWPFVHIAAAIGRCLRPFADNVSPTRVALGFRERVYSTMPGFLGFPVAISWPPDSTLPLQLGATAGRRPDGWEA